MIIQKNASHPHLIKYCYSFLYTFFFLLLRPVFRLFIAHFFFFSMLFYLGILASSLLNHWEDFRCVSGCGFGDIKKVALPSGSQLHLVDEYRRKKENFSLVLEKERSSDIRGIEQLVFTGDSDRWAELISLISRLSNTFRALPFFLIVRFYFALLHLFLSWGVLSFILLFLLLSFYSELQDNCFQAECFAEVLNSKHRLTFQIPTSDLDRPILKSREGNGKTWAASECNGVLFLYS